MSGVALITGAGKGIGRALAVRLAEEGWKVALVARTAADLAETAAQVQAVGGTALELPGDVSDRAAVEAAVAATGAELGPIDLLINNAARSASWGGEKFWEVDPDDWWQRVETNLRGPALYSRTVLPGMVQRGSGRIVMMNSEAGAITLAMTDGAYPVSKGALFRLTDHLGAQLAGTGVVVLDLSPGLVKTQANDNPNIPESAWTPITKICDLVVRVAAGEFDSLSGRFIHATDDLDAVAAQADAIVAADGRTLRMKAGFAGDPRGPRS
jgi:NAD(P)-dependent dehydrogenase (short-subunit alcohol dehydrogenase family)